MSWRRLNPDEPETIYSSNATELEQLTADLKVVVDRMTENREADAAADAKQLLCYINATNGYIRLMWRSDTDALGTWVYHLDLDALHEGGDAFVFDKMCYNAIWDFTEEFMFDEQGDSVYSIFYRTELMSNVEEILI
jgi:hypothetical protein